MKKIFVICSVRGMSDEYRKKLEEHVEILERFGDEVHLPHRDTDQDATGINICIQNMNAIRLADEVHIFYSSKSTGTHFDMGVAFAFKKKMVVIENEPFDEGKSFARMLTEWEDMSDVKMDEYTKKTFFEMLKKPMKDVDGYEQHLQYCWDNNDAKSIFEITGLDFSRALKSRSKLTVEPRI